ncbi:MAG: hypothetical protein ACK5GU_08225 [Chloroflexota bacterium]|jgi:hypothetical protein
MRRLLILFVVALTLLFPVAAFPQARSFLRGFAEQFTNYPTNWGIINGKWSYGSGYLYGAPTASDSMTAVYFKPAGYATLDYSVKIKRVGCAGCATGIIVRGNGPVYSDGMLGNGLYFMYSNNGYINIFKMVNGRFTQLRNWSPASRIVNGGWNTVRVTAAGNMYKMYINNGFVTQVIDSSRTNGVVGITMYSPSTSGNSMLIDWALLTTTVR